MAGRGSVIKKQWKDGKRVTYYVKYQLPGQRQKMEKVGPSKKAAERVLAERLAALNAGTYRELREATFEEFSLKWLAYMEPQVKPSTFDSYARYFANHHVPAFGRYPLQALTPGLIQEFVAGLQAKELSGKSINNFLVPLKKMLADAVRWGYLAVSPAADIERAKVHQQEMRALSPEEVRRFLAAAEPDYWLLFATAVFTGLRRGEVLALQWGDIDWQRHQINVRRSLWRGQFIGPKTKRAYRSVDLAPQLEAALLEARPNLRTGELATTLIFSNRNGRPLEPDNLVKRHFLPTLARAELPRIRYHDLRHTTASLLIAAGEHPKAIQAMLGHASIQTTLDRYGHLLPGAYAHVGQRLEKTVLGDEPLPRPSVRLSEKPEHLHNQNHNNQVPD